MTDGTVGIRPTAVEDDDHRVVFLRNALQDVFGPLGRVSRFEARELGAAPVGSALAANQAAVQIRNEALRTLLE